MLNSAMAVQSSSSEDARTGEVQAPASEAPTRQFAIFAGGEGCANCGSPLSSDQRYCVACGERRGRPRFPVADLAAPASRARARGGTSDPGRHLVGRHDARHGYRHATAGDGRRRADRPHRPGSPQKAAAAPSVITVNGGGGAAPTPASISSSTGTSAKKAKPVKGLPPKKVIVKAQQQASKVLGGSNLPPPTVKVGQSGSGPGFQGGKFTGNFFGQ